MHSARLREDGHILNAQESCVVMALILDCAVLDHSSWGWTTADLLSQR